MAGMVRGQRSELTPSSDVQDRLATQQVETKKLSDELARLNAKLDALQQFFRGAGHSFAETCSYSASLGRSRTGSGASSAS